MLYTVMRTLVIALGCTAAGVGAMHMLQAQRYQTPALSRELRRYGGLLGTNVLVALLATLVNWYLPVLLSMAVQKERLRETVSNWLMLVLFALATAIVVLQKRRIPQRREFSWTRRVCRLITAVFLVNLLEAILLNALSLSPYLAFAGVDYVVLLCAMLLSPLEDRINARYYNQARKKLAAARNLIRIGVTGSYGKTETKLILRTLLSEKYRVLCTPPGFASAMGISRVVNEQLASGHQVFIAEMGAQKRGEIREMARLVRPNCGAITCIGAAHLDSFGSLEAVAQAKYELIKSLPEDGKAFFGADGSYGDRLYALCKAEKYRAGAEAAGECFMRAEHVETGAKGTRFELACADGGHIWVQTRLLGIYAVRNIALAAAIARKLGLSMEEIARGVGKLKPIRGRMQLVPGEINVIDDSENALPEAAAEALRVLSEFPGRRILVTAGLDPAAQDSNYAFGMQAAACADHVVLVGPEDTREVMRGLMSARYPKSSVRMVREAGDAAALVKELATQGDSVLYEGVYPEAAD